MFSTLIWNTFTVSLYLILNNYIQENIVAFIMGTKDIEKDWNAYVAGVEGLGPSSWRLLRRLTTSSS